MAADNLPQHAAGTEVAHHEGEHERPEDWGWHHEFSTGRQVAGWICVLVLIALLTATHYNLAGSLAILLVIIGLVTGLLVDRRRRRTQWRR